MTREERCELAIERGYTYDPETGFIYNRVKKPILNKDEKNYIIFQLTINKKTYNIRGHHFAWYYFYGNCNINQIDHINGVRHDNKIVNLRNVTSQQNAMNRIKAKGCYWHKNSNKWKSQITINRKIIYLGFFNTEEEARNAYLAAKEKYHVI